MRNCLPINDDGSLCVPFYIIFESLCKECGLPKDLDYWNISDSKVWRSVPVYHNSEEEEIYTANKEKVEVALAIRTIKSYLESQCKN